MLEISFSTIFTIGFIVGAILILTGVILMSKEFHFPGGICLAVGLVLCFLCPLCGVKHEVGKAIEEGQKKPAIVCEVCHNEGEELDAFCSRCGAVLNEELIELPESMKTFDPSKVNELVESFSADDER